MKRLLLLCLLGCTGQADGQMIHSSTLITERTALAPKYKPLTTGYRGFAEAAVMSEEFDEIAFELSTTHGYQFNSWLFMGAGAAATLYQNWGKDKLYGIPVYVSARFYIGKRTIKPYFDLRAGYMFSCNTKNSRHSYDINDYQNGTQLLVAVNVSESSEKIDGFYIAPTIGLEIGRFDLSLGVTRFGDKEDFSSRYIFTPYGESMYPDDYYPNYKNNDKMSVWDVTFRLGVNF